MEKIKRQYKLLRKEQRHLDRELINSGRGMEIHSTTMKATDELSKRYQENVNKRQQLKLEALRLFGSEFDPRFIDCFRED